MGFFNDSNADATSTSWENVTVGPRLGFLGGLEAAYDAQVKASSLFAIERSMRETVDKAHTEAKAKGVQPPMFPSDVRFIDIARNAVDGTPLDGKDKLDDYDRQAKALGLPTAAEMFQSVQQRAQAAERTARMSATTIGGDIGEFIGSAVGGLDPRSDPLNFFTLPFGGAGKSVVTRVATQAGGQAAVEAINQLTGVQEERRLLGLDHGFGNAAMQVAGAAAGAAGIQLFGEGVAALGKRWFRNVPNDPAPPAPEVPRVEPPKAKEDVEAARLIEQPEAVTDALAASSPLSRNRIGELRAREDIDHVATALDDWHGPAPLDIRPPRTETAVGATMGEMRPVISGMAEATDRAGVDALAREIDPETFRIYDELATQRDTFRRWLDELRGPQQAEAERRTADLTAEIDRLTARLEGANQRMTKKYEARIAELDTQRQAVMREVTAYDTPDMAKVRSELMRVDVQMRDLAPVVTRAYDHARGQWASEAPQREAVLQMIREGRRSLPEPPQAAEALADGMDAPAPRPAVQGPPTLQDRVPVLRQRPEVVEAARPGDDAADLALRVLETNAKEAGDSLARTRALIDKMLSEADAAELKLDGYETPLHLDNDTIEVPLRDGEGSRTMTLRQALEDLKNDDLELQAVTTCSMRKPS